MSTAASGSHVRGERPIGAPFYTVEQAAQHLNTTPRFIRRLIAERRIAFTRLGRHIRIGQDDLDAFVANGRVEALRIPAPQRRTG